ncbi:TetR/AcrR family transcriptional regulator [Roseibacterium sp. SDUM158016]|uniref:TetR/AcrR family transcriptional regulator n=1 Tax=Roseicyclus sediminis TaxID=2980997 RepID=UPI0021D386CB|nr:TetR/AcrR family transcriptional regulator [Roseibacterium sp. SDUM158016]MCU4653241.1 TetR/AcrR family transcriptional regulator [Roseibacterium sp. SDUM158016]
MTKNRKNYHHGALKEQLVEAVRQLIETQGPDGFTIAEACRLAGVSTAAPYKHFRDREEILHAVILAAMHRMGAAMQAAADAYPAGDPERVVALGRAYIGFARAEPGVFALMFGHAGHHDEDEALAEEGRGKFAIVLRVVAEHIGRPPEDPEVNARAYALWCAVHGHCFLALDGKADKTEIMVSEEEYLRLVGRSYLP